MLGFTSVQPNLHLLHLDAITVIGVKDLDFAGEFVRFVWGCDEMEISSRKLYAW